MLLKIIKFALMFAAFIFFAAACQKSDDLALISEKSEVKQNDLGVPNENFLTFESVRNTLLSAGWIQLEHLPDGFLPVFENYNSIVAFSNSQNEFVYVYRFTDLQIEDGGGNKEKCTNKWNPGRIDDQGNLVDYGCFDPGTDCGVELKDKNDPKAGINVICCD